MDSDIESGQSLAEMAARCADERSARRSGRGRPGDIGISRAAHMGQIEAKPQGGPFSGAALESAGKLRPLGIDEGCDGLVYVPASYRPDRPAPLVLLLHGAGGNSSHGVQLLMPYADSAGTILLAPDAKRETWDELIAGFGPDVDFIDRALRRTFKTYAVDPEHVAIGGFSDGASYALSLGITNGLLFRRILAFSPGFMAPSGREDKPEIFISHGTRDAVLPIDHCSRRIVPALRKLGYNVAYREFDGPHTVPPEMAQEAVAWFLGHGSGGY